ncbi:Selenoprotein O and cysteine-containing homologs [Bathymodiolus heckerae thiotrophic gill symbiont]|uniref:protein adenylyltransferase SelO n=1 Tax=Bathymodiolus heckerae thiotrophic gill symbiont TaxID=1052212 RepID=UPI0010BA4D7D|nr:protein adenylyltransferase SelO family protein [Bathymodiolus heckerae thiotrophic gill symbiont]CAC9604297.1 Selenoprotein O and cysteine-containing homologs [uncultured Gammaproteobacteria bacterium]SHN89475.1 Selenoprotein O and cysteine-containing homologs [Bathymodiolus heckerae thiotrophic gill symbiont]
MKNKPSPTIKTLDDLAKLADYSFVNTLNCDPDTKINGVDHDPRQVFTGHYTLVNPTPIKNPEYITHSKDFFNELGFNDSLAQSDNFIRLFSGDTSHLPKSIRTAGWATGYALSIFGTEYYQQCPFQTGNGYGDGRAISILEVVANDQRWEMQLKGGGRTPYCRGADGRAVLRSSIREFLAQEHMHALGVPTSRSLSLYVSKTQKVNRPWYSQGSRSMDPDMLASESIAISTRVAPSFIRVGQLELFGRRARKQEHPKAMEELEMLVLHLIDREYADEIDNTLSTGKKVVQLAHRFRDRLISLVANWIRVGYCQGNFNSDNCAAGGFTLDYGPFGFCDEFDSQYQPWSSGGLHFSFLNQPIAAEQNFKMFCNALLPLLESDQELSSKLINVFNGFSAAMKIQMEKMWRAKLGIFAFDVTLFDELVILMEKTPVDYTLFFRELSEVPADIEPLKKSFYRSTSEQIDKHWLEWFEKWRKLNACSINKNSASLSREQLSKQMKLVNPKYSLREWFVAPAYQQAAERDYSLVRELQAVITQPYAEQSKDVEEKYYKLKPDELFNIGGLSQYSCSS